MVVRSTVSKAIRSSVRATTGNGGGAGGGGGGEPVAFLLDTYTGAAAAYSLRKLRTDYAGSCIRVRRSSDSAEQDIGFVSGVLDTAALLTFCGAGDGFVTTWYDQSGNTRDATQATTTLQPQIVSGGTVIEENSKPALNWGATTNSRKLVWSGSVMHGYAVNVARWLGGGSMAIQGLLTSGTQYGLIGSMGGQSWFTSGNYLASQRVNGAAQTIGWTGLLAAIAAQSIIVSIPTAYTSRSGIVIGSDRTQTSRGWLGTIQESVIYPDDRSATISDIEANVGTFYGITLP